MVLFTTPGAPAATPPPPPSPPGGDTVVDGIRRGADASGVDFDYLLRTAKRESSLDPTAKASTSSATGLFQFLEQTWLGLVKSDGGRLGLGDAAQAVTARGDGTYAVSDPAARSAILRLREDPGVAAALAGTLTRQNRDTLAAATGREPSAGELYMAHVLGARGASDLITTASTAPDTTAASVFPDAARANRGLFYDRSGRPRSAAELYAALGAAQAETGIVSARATAPAPAAATRTGPAATPDPPPYRPPGLQGLFQTGARSGPLSDAVSRIWRANTDGASGRAASGAASFFPRSGDTTSLFADLPEASPASPTATATAELSPVPASAGPSASATAVASVPLPPIRPRFFAPASSGAASSNTSGAPRP